jgi:hypothetical protein
MRRRDVIRLECYLDQRLAHVREQALSDMRDECVPLLLAAVGKIAAQLNTLAAQLNAQAEQTERLTAEIRERREQMRELTEQLRREGVTEE